MLLIPVVPASPWSRLCVVCVSRCPWSPLYLLWRFLRCSQILGGADDLSVVGVLLPSWEFETGRLLAESVGCIPVSRVCKRPPSSLQAPPSVRVCLEVAVCKEAGTTAHLFPSTNSID